MSKNDKDVEESIDPVSLETMLSEHSFKAGGRDYTIVPVRLKDMNEFFNDKIFITNDKNGYFSMAMMAMTDEQAPIIDKWIKRCLKYNGEYASLSLVSNEHGWFAVDLARFLCDLSGLSG